MTEPDPPVLEVLTRVIVWRQSLEPVEHPDDLSVEEYALIAAVDAFLASRHTLRGSQPETQDRNEE